MLTLTAPSVVFGAISLIFLAYTNRYLTLATVIRKLHATWRQTRDETLKSQITVLRERVTLITCIQISGLVSLFLAILSIIAILSGSQPWAAILFFFSLALMIVFIIIALIEVCKSAQALDIELDKWQDEH